MYLLCDPYRGLSVQVKPDQTEAFASWAGVSHGDLMKMCRGQQATAGDWRYDNTLWNHDPHGNYIRPSQLCQRFSPPAMQSGTRVPDSMRLTRAMLSLVLTDWEGMTLEQATKLAIEKRRLAWPQP